MSYEPTVWKDGDLVTSAKLNKMEEGIASGGDSGGGVIEVIEMTPTAEGLTLGKTAKEIANLIKSGKLVFVRYYQEHNNIYDYNGSYINVMHKGSSSPWQFMINVSDEDGGSLTCTFVAATDDDYPIYEFEEITDNPPDNPIVD